MKIKTKPFYTLFNIFTLATIYIFCESASDAIRFMLEGKAFYFPNPVVPILGIDLWHFMKFVWIPSLFLAGYLSYKLKAVFENWTIYVVWFLLILYRYLLFNELLLHWKI